jgi:hypothetical protein
MRLLRFLPLILEITVLGGCFQTRLSAPPGREVRVLSQDEPVKFRTEYKNFYLLYGFVPLWPTQPEEIIRKENLVEVRARTQDTVLDAIITAVSMLLPIMVFPQHVIVEGNRQSDLAVPVAPTDSSPASPRRNPGDESTPTPTPGR